MSAVSAQQIYIGAIGFSIITDGISRNTPSLSVMADPAGAFALINFCGDQGNQGQGCYFTDANSQNASYAFNTLPQYTVSVAQNVQSDGHSENPTAQQTVVSINPVQVQK